jgi:hypothetical protein
MLLIVGLFASVGCASGGKPFEPPPNQDQPDAPPNDPPDPPTPPVDAPMVDPPADAPNPPGPCTPQVIEKLTNPSLDLTPNGMGWTEVAIPNVPGGPYPIISADGAIQSAPNAAWFGGFAGEDATPAVGTLTDQLYQDVTFPADATTFIVSGMFLVGTTELPFPIVFDTFSLDVTETNGTVIQNVVRLDNTTDASTYTSFSVTITANLANRTVRLRGTSTNDTSNHTNFFLDSLSFKATHCP